MMHRWLFVLLFAFAVVAGAAWWLQRQSAAQLREEIALLHDESRRLAELRAENARLVAAQPPAAEIDRLRADRAAVVQFRGEIEKLKAGLDARERALNLPAEAKAAESNSAKAPVPQVLPAARRRNVGQDTPVAALETVLWAGTNRNVDALAATLSLDREAGALAAKIFEGLPEAQREEYATPLRMLAALLAKDMPLGDVRVMPAKPLDPDATVAALDAEMKNNDGEQTKEHFELVKLDGRWLLKVPAEVVEHFRPEPNAPPPK
jgi:hypothetical protein